MTVAPAHRGAACIGHLHDLDPMVTAAIIYLRMWSDSAHGPRSVASDMICTLGFQRGQKALETFAHLNEICQLHARRPLMRHALRCNRVGADEACFGHFIGTAAEGEAADALLFATLIVRADVAPTLAALATQFGLALKQMNLAACKPSEAGFATTQTIH